MHAGINIHFLEAQMRKLFLVVSVAVSVLSSGCYRLTLPGPDGQMHTVTPYGGSMVVRVYNTCAPLVHAEGLDHAVDIPFGQSVELVLPKVFGTGDNQPFSVIFSAYTGDHQLMGTHQEQFYPDYDAYVTRKQYMVGGQYTHIYDSNGRDACRQ